MATSTQQLPTTARVGLAEIDLRDFDWIRRSGGVGGGGRNSFGGQNSLPVRSNPSPCSAASAPAGRCSITIKYQSIGAFHRGWMVSPAGVDSSFTGRGLTMFQSSVIEECGAARNACFFFALSVPLVTSLI